MASGPGMTMCKTCSGTGVTMGKMMIGSCPTCKGSGMVPK